MAATATPATISHLVGRLYDADTDIRFMSLTDLLNILQNCQNMTSSLPGDYNQQAKLADGLITTLGDRNGDVQNLTIQALGPFVVKTHPNIPKPFIDRLCNMDMSQSVDSSIRALALRAIVMSMPHPVSGVQSSLETQKAYEELSSVMIPRLLGYKPASTTAQGLPAIPLGLLQEDIKKNVDNHNLDVLTEIARCFGLMLSVHEVAAFQKVLLQILGDERVGHVIKKKAVIALSALASFFNADMMSGLVTNIVQRMKDPHVTSMSRKIYITSLSSLARTVPLSFGQHIRTLAPFVLAVLSQEELDDQMREVDEEEGRDTQEDDVREAALIALETFLTYCTSDMQWYFDDCFDATMRFLKYDPNFADDDDDDDEQGSENGAEDEDDGFELEEDFEEEIAGDAGDDVSWKVRRCAARTLNVMISSRGSELVQEGSRVGIVLRALLGRLDEREDVVKIEVLAALGFLIRKVGDLEAQADLAIGNSVEVPAMSQPASKKRRRGASDLSMSESTKSIRLTGSTSPEHWSAPRSGPPANLAQMSNDLYTGLLKLLKSGTTPTKIAVTGVLKDLVVARRGNATEHLSTLVDLAVDNMSGATSSLSGGATTGPSIQLQTLQLVSEIAKSHASSVLLPYVGQIIPAVSSMIEAKYSLIACDALHTMDQIVKTITPPRHASNDQRSAAFLDKIFTLIMDTSNSRTADLSVRLAAIAVLGTIIGRTLAPKTKLLSSEQKMRALTHLLNGSRNETTRLASIRAIEAIAQQAPENTTFSPDWYYQACSEMGNQLRKADRAIRLAGLAALRALLVRHPGSAKLDAAAGQRLSVSVLAPLLATGDLSILSSIIMIYTSMIRARSCAITSDFVDGLCALIVTPAASPVLDNLCDLVTAIGEVKSGKELMTALLVKVGVGGSPAIVGKVIGNLLVSSGPEVGVRTKDFLKELRTTKDDKRKSLALSVLGEAGLRSGAAAADLSPTLFLEYFGTSSEVRLNAAVALGRASAGPGNIATWVPALLQRLQQHPDEHYLVLHAIKELLQYNENDKDIVVFAPNLWEASIVASRSEESKTVGAECVANLTLVDPQKYLPVLQSLLSDESSTVRGTAIMAFRDVLTISDASFDKDLRPVIVEVLTAMMRDSAVENRRSSLNTFNAAVRNKSSLVMPQMRELLPLVLDQTRKDPALMREVPMGPFKHIVDDGLEVRKNAYEMVYFLAEHAMNRLDIGEIYDRVVAGVNDDRGIQTLCNILTNKFAVTHPDETIKRLDEIVDSITVVVAFKPKENAVRHEHEKADEAKKGVIKVAYGLRKLFPDELASRKKWTVLMEEIKKPHNAELLKDVDREIREAARA